MSDNVPEWIRSVSIDGVDYLYRARTDTGEITSIKPEPTGYAYLELIKKDAEAHFQRQKHREEVCDQLTILSVGEVISEDDGPQERMGAMASYGDEEGGTHFTIEIVDAGPTYFKIHGTMTFDLYFFQIIAAFLRIINLPTTKAGNKFQLRDYV
jgi:hypothetical protein